MELPENELVFDAIVIGSGPAGRSVSADLVKNGLSVALIEAELVGGDCAYWACVPSKALLRPQEALNEAKHIEGASEAINGNAVNSESVFKRRDKFVENWDDTNFSRSLEQTGIKVTHGHGELAGQKRVRVKSSSSDKSGQQQQQEYWLTARHAVILATGSRAAFPSEIAGLVDSKPWNSRNATGAHKAPESLAIFGMGAVACEMATTMASLGTKEITIIGRDDRLLNKYEPFVGERLGQVFENRGIKVLTKRNIRRINRTTNNGDSKSEPFEILLDDNSKVTTAQFLVATGREPNTNSLGLETIGLQSGRWLDVDDTCLVKGVEGEWLYAVGDISRRALLTHVGKYQGRVCAASIISRAAKKNPSPASLPLATSDHDAVPQVVFTDPEVATVGLTESEARKKGFKNLRVIDRDMDGIPGAALHTDGYSGHARIIVDQDRRVIIGSTFIGPQVGDLLHAATIAIVGKVPMTTLRHAIPCFPTVNEVWLDLLDSYGFSESNLTPSTPEVVAA